MKLKLILTAVLLTVLTVFQTAQAQKVYWVERFGHSLYRANLDGSLMELLESDMDPLNVNMREEGLAVDPLRGKVFITSQSNSIYALNLDGSNLATPAATPFVRGVSLDAENGWLYGKRSNGNLGRFHVDTQAIENLVSIPGGEGVALDLANGKVYWANWSAKTISRSNLNGSVVEQVVAGITVGPEGLDVDAAGGKIYWAQGDGLNRADLNGANIEQLIDNTYGLVADVVLDVAAGKLYVAAATAILRADLNGANLEVISTTGGTEIALDLSVDTMGLGFTYQGELVENGLPVNDTVDLQFRLYSNSTTLVQLGQTVTHSGMAITDGRFTVELDFLTGNLGAKPRWLEIAVQGSGDPSYITLAPRQRIAGTPVAAYALKAGMVDQEFGSDGSDHSHSSLDAPDGDPVDILSVADNGFVGINRTSTVTSSEYFGLTTPTGDGAYGGMYLDTEHAGGRPFYGYATGGSAQAWTYYDGQTDKWYLNNGGNRLTVKGTGEVGIGTENPQAKLQVSGGETILEQEPWQIPTLLNGWLNFGGDFNDAGYFKDSMGVVHLRGMVKSGVVGPAIFTLPVGYRPLNRSVFITANASASRIDVSATGDVLLAYGIALWVPLDGITFRAEQ